jgi:hypothetical protein
MDEVQKIDTSNSAPSSKTFRDESNVAVSSQLKIFAIQLFLI